MSEPRYSNISLGPGDLRRYRQFPISSSTLYPGPPQYDAASAERRRPESAQSQSSSSFRLPGESDAAVPAQMPSRTEQLKLQVSVLLEINPILKSLNKKCRTKNWFGIASTNYKVLPEALLADCRCIAHFEDKLAPSMNFTEDEVRRVLLPAHSVKHIVKALVRALQYRHNGGVYECRETHALLTNLLKMISWAVDLTGNNIFGKETRMEIAATGNFVAFVALSEHMPKLGLMKYFLHALEHNQVHFAGYLIQKKDWPRNEQLVIDGGLRARRLRHKYERIVKSAAANSRKIGTASWILQEFESEAGLSRRLLVMRAMAVHDPKIIIDCYVGSSAKFRRRRSSREAEYLWRTFLVKDLAVLQHVLSKTEYLSRRKMANIKATIIAECALNKYELKNLHQLTEPWAEKKAQSSIVRSFRGKAGKPMKSKSARQRWAHAGDAFARAVSAELLDKQNTPEWVDAE